MGNERFISQQGGTVIAQLLQGREGERGGGWGYQPWGSNVTAGNHDRGEKKTCCLEQKGERESVCVCVCVFVHLCGREEKDRERDRAKKQPLGYLPLTLSSWGGGCSPIPPQIQGGAQFPFPTSRTDPWPSNHCQMCPCRWISQASPRPLFPPSFFLSDTPQPHQVNPPFSHPASRTPLGVGSGMFLVSSQLGSPGNPRSGRKGPGSFACTL